MSMSSGYSESFLIDGHRIEVEFKALDGETMAAVRDEIRKDNFARAEILLLGGAIESLSRDDKPIIRKRNRAERRSGGRMGSDEGIPNDYDEGTDELLVDKLLKSVVAHEPLLARKQPFKDVFEQYGEKNDEAPKKDPTPLRVETQKTGS
jgi:hypothetical protein